MYYTNLMALVFVSERTKEIVKNLYLSDIPEEFIALQLDIEIPNVLAILEELGVNRK